MDSEDEMDVDLLQHAPYIEVNAVKTKQKQGRVVKNLPISKDIERNVAMAIVVEMLVNEKPARVLLDSGSLGDFISSTLVDQLNIKPQTLEKPIGLTMAVAGLHEAIKHSAEVNIKYQEIDGMYRLDVVNLDRYDLILGTSFLHRHSIVLSFNPHAVHIRSVKQLPLIGPLVKTIRSRGADVYKEKLEKKSKDICRGAADVPLPPSRVINHRIPLINENAVYSYRTSRCPKALVGQWERKLSAYISTGIWQHATGKNVVPMLFTPKKGTEGESTLTAILAKQENIASAEEMASPKPDIQDVLWDVSKYPYKSLMDGNDAYKQTRVEPKDMYKTLFAIPSGTMISQLVQQGDCSAGATYQSLMRSLFARGTGEFVHVFLDDMVIFTKTSAAHTATQSGISSLYARWKRSINGFGLIIIHIPGRYHILADGLSRMYAGEPQKAGRAKLECLLQGDAGERMELSNVDYNTRVPLTEPLYVGSAAILTFAPDAHALGAGNELSANAEMRSHDVGSLEVGPHTGAQMATSDSLPKIRLPGVVRKSIGDCPGGAQGDGITPEKRGKAEGAPEKNKTSKRVGECAYYYASPTFLYDLGEYFYDSQLFSELVANPSQFNNFDCSSWIPYIRPKSERAICVSDVEVNGWRAREIMSKETYDLLMRVVSTQRTNAPIEGSARANVASSDSDALQPTHKIIQVLLTLQKELRAVLKSANYHEGGIIAEGPGEPSSTVPWPEKYQVDHWLSPETCEITFKIVFPVYYANRGGRMERLCNTYAHTQKDKQTPRL